MKVKKRTASEKFQIVLDGLRSECTVGELCSRYGVSQAQYYKWRDQFLKNGTKAFEGDTSIQLIYAKAENRRLKSIIGDLTVELKKTENDLGWTS
jgi:transposase-like protein